MLTEKIDRGGGALARNEEKIKVSGRTSCHDRPPQGDLAPLKGKPLKSISQLPAIAEAKAIKGDSVNLTDWADHLGYRE